MTSTGPTTKFIQGLFLDDFLRENMVEVPRFPESEIKTMTLTSQTLSQPNFQRHLK